MTRFDRKRPDQARTEWVRLSFPLRVPDKSIVPHAFFLPSVWKKDEDIPQRMKVK